MKMCEYVYVCVVCTVHTHFIHVIPVHGKRKKNYDANERKWEQSYGERVRDSG